MQVKPANIGRWVYRIYFNMACKIIPCKPSLVQFFFTELKFQVNLTLQLAINLI